MLLDPVAVNRKGETPKWLCKCDWDGCNRTFLHGHKHGPHYCPHQHSQANKLETSRIAHKRWYEKKNEGKTKVVRPQTEKKERIWTDTTPRCPVCNELISVLGDCNCPKDEVERQWESIWK